MISFEPSNVTPKLVPDLRHYVGTTPGGTPEPFLSRLGMLIISSLLLQSSTREAVRKQLRMAHPEAPHRPQVEGGGLEGRSLFDPTIF